MTWYSYVNALSLDVVIGAVISTHFFARLLGVILPAEVPISLGLAVWSIYTIDHLWDARRSKHPIITFRHQFHKKNFNTLSVLIVVTISAGLILLPMLPVETYQWGMGLSVMVAFYFLMTGFNKRPIYHKEIFVAIIYTLGVVTGPLSLNLKALEFTTILLIAQFMMLALANLMVFAHFESDKDQLQDFGSLIGTIGRRKSGLLITALLVLVIASSLVAALIWKEPQLRKSCLILLAMACSLFAIFSWPGFFSKSERFRFFGDATFIIPVLVI